MNLIDLEISPFFAWLLRTTVQGSVLIGLIIIVRWLFRGKLTARWQYALWLLVLIRLAVPWMPQSRFSLSSVLFRSLPGSHSSTLPINNTGNGGVSEISNSTATSGQESKPVATEEQASTSAFEDTKATGIESSPVATDRPYNSVRRGRPSVSIVVTWLKAAWPALWFAGALGLLSYIGFRNLRLWLDVTAERQLIDQDVLELLEDCKQQMQIKTPVSVVVMEKLRSPALFGFVRPRILLPQGLLEMLSLDELQYVFLHELAHLKRGDIYVSWLTSVLQSLHWFNPVTWLGFRYMHADQELACDALAMSRLESEESAQYGRTLVRLLERFSQPQYVPSIAGILEDKSRLERRMTMIAKFQKDSYQWSPLAVTLIVILSLLVLPDAKRTKARAASPVLPASQTTLRKIWSGSDVDTCGTFSGDGRYLSYVDWKTGDLAIREIATGKTRRLTDKGSSEVPKKAFALYSTISRDGRYVAYSWFNRHETYDLCLIGIDGTGDRTLCTSEDYEFYPACWSSDGRHILARRYGKDKGTEIISVKVEDQSTRVLKTFPGVTFWVLLCYSPDDQCVAYDFPVVGDEGNYDIRLLSTNGDGEVTLVEHPANDRLLGWVPDRDEILFLSDRAGTEDLWMIQVKDGIPYGSPKRIKSDIGQISPMGFTNDDSLYFNIVSRFFNTHVATLDLETGTTVAPLQQPFTGSSLCPEWSPDGEHVAYVSVKATPAGGFVHVLHVRSLRTGQDREVACQLKRLTGLLQS